MRKLKIKKEETKNKIVDNQENNDLKNLPFSKLDYVLYLIFFVVSVINETPGRLVLIIFAIFGASLLFKRFSDKLSIGFVYRMFVFALLSLLAWPVNVLIKYFLG
ncbi:hypothetical protein [Streptobacillus moniliformis]|uniref:Uncharacterized protein n=1 Tax=Streptobacillus moniliformis (strain ATCC 14647 / DSM 12112 / NCTC 10651 / 9901) TaxID=519441 RepID=D1AYD6_STRM9|nr:hypothetical protein [Streptobacillus moniliformis]ACZ01312.1 hypothetical protein Smon_0844 [Streptobacillus moniliformis DSM 12112]AVL43666.1 hypothetical protein CEP89_07625 [Streptobacillus moniliformis]SQA13530.1 Uncharacterised protein [Streptobacillus moniliformis]